MSVPLFRRPQSATDSGEAEAGEVIKPEVVDPEEAQLPPSRMRGTEPLYGYVVALELFVVGILNLVITTGKGAPAHPQTGLEIVGVIAPLIFVGLLVRFRNRTIVGFAAIVAAFFVTLPRVPSSLAIAHVFALVVPLGYGLIITQRQRRALGKEMRSGTRKGANRASTGSSARGAEGRADRRRGRKRSQPEPTGPRPSARYTPPKAKRGKAAR